MSFQPGQSMAQYASDDGPPPYSQASYFPPATGLGNSQYSITQQPKAGQIQSGQGWMASTSQVPADIPAGLQYLASIDLLLIKQQVELLDSSFGSQANKYSYTIKNNRGEKVYYTIEDTDCCTRMWCGPMRPFDMKILDIYQNEIIHLRRELICGSCCGPFCLQNIEVYLSDGKLAGTVEQKWSFFTPIFDIKDGNGNTVLKIKGPMCTVKCFSNVDFKILSTDMTIEVGKISKHWSGISRGLFIGTDFFGVSFPVDLDVRMKAVLVGACFLIDFMYFEHPIQGNTLLMSIRNQC